MDIFLNGQFIAPENATIPFDDAGLQHGIGLFETMQAFNGVVFRLEEHLERLQKSATTLGLVRTLQTEPLAEAVEALLKHNGQTEARVRLTLTAGSTNLLRPPADTGSGSTPPGPTLMVVSEPPTQYDPQYFEQGILALIAPPSANPFDPMAGHKTLNYWNNLRTLRQAASAGAGEAIQLAVTNHIACGCVSNVFLVKDGALFTPIARGEEIDQGLPSPVLPGITRQAVLELAEDLDITVNKHMLSVEDLLNADEVFLTNSSWHLLPVTRIEKSKVAEGEVGEVTKQLRGELLKLIQRETASGDA